jgi:hypothetical protein
VEGLEVFPMGLSVRVAGNTVTLSMSRCTLGPGALRSSGELPLSRNLVLLLQLHFHHCYTQAYSLLIQTSTESFSRSPFVLRMVGRKKLFVHCAL